MKTLYVLRHGQAVSDAEGASDHQRILTVRGRADVLRAAGQLEQRAAVPGLIIASSAARAQQTAELCAGAWSSAPDVCVLDELYLAEPATYLSALSAHGQAHARVMVVGHNPGLEALVFLLTECSEHLPTAGLVEIELDLGSWSGFSEDARAHGRVVAAFRG